MKIVILGCAGAGKDTLADQIMDKYNYTMLSPGSIFRKEAEDKTELGLYARDMYWAKGNLCPDEIVNKLVKNTIDKLPNTNNLIFNGYPRSLCQAEFLKVTCDIDIVIDLEIELNVALKRLMSRGREDDSKKVIRQRYKQYNEITKPISNYYKQSRTKYIAINADQLPEEVFKLVLKNL